MQKRKTELLNIGNQWWSQLQTLPQYKVKDDLSWWPTTSGEHEKLINDVTQLPHVHNQLDWDNYMDDTSSVGGDMEGPTEEDQKVDQIFDGWFEEDESEDEVTRGHSDKRRKFG